MLDEQLVKEAETNVRQYLLENLLKKQTNETAKAMYIENADLSLETSRKLLTLESKDDALLKSLDEEREKRSKFQYQMDEQAKRAKALTSLERAKGFMFEMKKLL